MKTVNVNRINLLEIVKKNREDHNKLFEELNSKYRTSVIEALGNRLESIKAGAKISLFFSLPEPLNHSRDYDRVIKMLEMSTDSSVELTANEFDNFVRDMWHWTAGIASQSQAYGVDNAVSRKYTDLSNEA